MSAAGNITYDSVTTTTAELTLENERRWVGNSALNTDKTEFYLNLDKDAQPQIDTISVAASLPASDAYYKVTIAGVTTTRTFIYAYLTASTDTDATIEARLAELINLHPDVSAVIDGGNVKVTSLVPGTNGAFTTTVDCLNVGTNATIASKITATSVAGTGTGKVRKIADISVELRVDSSGSPQLRVTGNWYSGAAVPVLANAFGPNPFSAPKKMDDYRVVV